MIIIKYFAQYVASTKKVPGLITVGMNIIVLNLKTSQVIQLVQLLEGVLVGLHCWFVSLLFTVYGSTEGLIRPGKSRQRIIT